MTNSKKKVKTETPDRPAHTRARRESSSRIGSRDVSRPKISAADAFAAAEKILRKGAKLDMAALALDLGIGRATLYRWTGDRERLIKVVFAMYLLDTLNWIDHRLDKEKIEGSERIARVVEEMMRVLANSRPVKGLLRSEPNVALRLLTGDGVESLQGVTIVKLTGIIEQEVEKGTYKPRLDPHLLAYTAIRLVDSFVFGDIIAGVEVELNTASKVIRSLL